MSTSIISAGLRLLTKRYGWRVYASCGTLEAIADTRPLEPQTVCEVIGETGVCAAGMEIQPFATSHDSRESLGFRITLPGGRRVAVATDTVVNDRYGARGAVRLRSGTYRIEPRCADAGKRTVSRIISSAGFWRIRAIFRTMHARRS